MEKMCPRRTQKGRITVESFLCAAKLTRAFSCVRIRLMVGDEQRFALVDDVVRDGSRLELHALLNKTFCVEIYTRSHLSSYLHFLVISFCMTCAWGADVGDEYRSPKRPRRLQRSPLRFHRNQLVMTDPCLCVCFLLLLLSLLHLFWLVKFCVLL